MSDEADMKILTAAAARRQPGVTVQRGLGVDLETMIARAQRGQERLGLVPDAPPVDEAKAERQGIAERALACFPDVAWARFGEPIFERQCHAEVRRALAAWTRHSGNLLLLGPTGAGKTIGVVAAAAKILDEAVAGGGRGWGFARRIGFTTAARLARARREHELGAADAPLVRRSMSYSLLFLDELGYLDGDRDTTVAEVICERDYRNLPTIATSGMTTPELFARYGSATVRKLTERGQFVSVHP